ncbi:hypothetical protein K432DRAFT_247154, partial [Lepidopterella palustris CBS 459.81]
LIGSRNSRQCQEILEWLSPLDFRSQQIYLSRRRMEGTGSWLSDSSQFQKWLNGSPGSTLWYTGIPGSGKTYLTSMVVDYLQRIFHGQEFAIAYIYCSFHEEQLQKPVNLVASLLRQLVENHGVISDKIQSLFQRHKQPTLDELFDLLKSEVGRFSRVFVVIDALDESSESTANEFLERIRLLQPYIRLLLMSRPNFVIGNRLKNAVHGEVRTSDHDIQIYLQRRIENDSRLKHLIGDSLREEIVATIVREAQGMQLVIMYTLLILVPRFLLAKLHFDSLADKISTEGIHMALATLPKELDSVYDGVIRTIRSQNARNVKLAEQILCWVSYAFRPLTVTEILHALAVQPGDKSLSENHTTTKDDLVSVCAGLVIVNQETHKVDFAHDTIGLYLKRIRVDSFPNAQTRLATICLTYISFEDFGQGPCDSDQKMERRLDEYPFLKYAAQHWCDHARGEPEAEKRVQTLIKSFLQDNKKLTCSYQVMHLPEQRYENYSQNFPEHLDGLAIAASFGLEKIVGLLV